MITQRLVALAVALLACPASGWAVPILVTNYDAVLAGIESCGTCSLVASAGADFTAASPPPATVGSIATFVYFDTLTAKYTYRHDVRATIDDIRAFTTAVGGAYQFDGTGATTQAGWSFSSAAAAGGAGTSTDFLVDYNAGTQRLSWDTNWFEGTAPATLGWDGTDPAITFFFQSTVAPGAGDYNLANGDVGTATTLASTAPEPGSMILLGTGLLGMASALRRRGKKGNQPLAS